jgi:hypothetical protein
MTVMDLQDRKKHMRRALTVLKRLFTALGFVSAVIGLIAAVVYLFFRIAVFDNQVYAYLYLAVTLLFFIYVLLLLAKRHLLGRVLLRISWIFIVIFSLCFIVAAVFVYGSLFVRNPVVGFTTAPVLIFCLIYFLPRLKPLRRLKGYFIKVG